MSEIHIKLLLIAFVIIALWWAILFTGVLSKKPHSKLNLGFNIAILAYGVFFLIMTLATDSYYMSFETALVYGSVALAAWITNNKILKTIRLILFCAATLALANILVIIILTSLLPPSLAGLRGLC